MLGVDLQRQPNARPADPGPAVRWLAAAIPCLLLILFAFGCTSGSMTVGDLSRPQAGEIIFGRDLDATNTMVRGAASEFSRSDEGRIAFASLFADFVSGDVQVEVAIDDGLPVTVGEPYTFLTPGNFYSADLDPASLPVGPVHFRIVQGRTLLAEGSIVIVD